PAKKPTKAKKTAAKKKKAGEDDAPPEAAPEAASEAADDAAPNGEDTEATEAPAPPKAKRNGPLALVVAPTSVVPNWVREISRFAPGLKALAWSGADREKYRDQLSRVDVVVTSYALLRRDEELLTTLECGYVILDEAQHIKNPLSATARVARALNGEHRLAL